MGMETMSHITGPHSDWQPRPPVPRFRRVSEKHYEVSNFPLDWKMPRPFHVKSNFKTFKVRRRSPSFVEAFIKSNLPPVFMSVPEYSQRWGPSQIINAGWYMTIQEAVDEANGEKMVFIPEGTYDTGGMAVPVISITESNTFIVGTCRGTVIDSGTLAFAIWCVGATDVIVSNLEVRTTPGGGAGFSPVLFNNADRSKAVGVYVNGSDIHGILLTGTGIDMEILDCYVFDADEMGINVSAVGNDRVKILNCTVEQAGTHGITLVADDGIVNDNIINGVGADGILLSGDNNIVNFNRITGWTQEPIDDDGYGNDTSHNRVTP